ncbi:helix-turn-helix domain-containing protein [Hymenobacter sp. B81]|uniref:helix-turn-helix domain-containing protein n=1 Tax=Hymenobacter sp. B81 TaxID=3344878 RepID=UPI0037DC26D4
MTAADLVTVGILDQYFQAIKGLVETLGAATPAAGTQVPRLLSIEQVMAELDVSRSTVQRWINNGKRGRDGSTITLQVYHFSPSEPRIPWPALAAFGQGLPFDLATMSIPTMRAAS